MSLKERFRDPTKRNAALVKIFFVWPDSDKSNTQYSRPEYDKRGFDYAAQRTVAYYTKTFADKIKDQRIIVYCNQTKAQRGVYLSGIKQP